MDPSALLCQGARDAVMTTMTKGAIKSHNSTKIIQLTKEKQRSTKHHTENQRMDKTALNTHLSYIPPMLMLKIYRPHWTQYDENTLHDLSGLVMVR
jgi:hypothetical protein